MPDLRRRFRCHIVTASPPAPRRATRIHACLAAVAVVSGFTQEELRGSRQRAEVCKARFVAIGLIWDTCPHAGTMDVARVMNRDHTTILHARRRYTALLAADATARRWRDDAAAMIARRTPHGGAP